MKSNSQTFSQQAPPVPDITPCSRPGHSPDSGDRHPSVSKGVLVFQLSAHSPFRSAERMQRAISVHEFHRVLVFRCGGVHAIPPGEEGLLEHVIKRTRRYRGQVILSEVDDELRQSILRAGLIDVIGAANITAAFDGAMVRAEELLSKTNRP